MSRTCMQWQTIADARDKDAWERKACATSGRIDALGGRAALEGISSLRIESIGHDYFIDQSERPEGPFIVRYLSTVETRDVAGGRSPIDLAA